jgi:hypothetical protein
MDLQDFSYGRRKVVFSQPKNFLRNFKDFLFLRFTGNPGRTELDFLSFFNSGGFSKPMPEEWKRER